MGCIMSLVCLLEPGVRLARPLRHLAVAIRVQRQIWLSALTSPGAGCRCSQGLWNPITTHRFLRRLLSILTTVVDVSHWSCASVLSLNYHVLPRT